MLHTGICPFQTRLSDTLGWSYTDITRVNSMNKTHVIKIGRPPFSSLSQSLSSVPSLLEETGKGGGEGEKEEEQRGMKKAGVSSISLISGFLSFSLARSLPRSLSVPCSVSPWGVEA